MRTFARGEEVGPYRILAPLGLGATGGVYLARRSDVVDVHRRPVALKLLSVAHQPHGDPYAAFRNEARVGQMLHHQNVVQLYDFGRLPDLDSLYLEIEWVRGCDLDRLLHFLRKTDRRLPVGMACRICCDIAQGLAYAHDCYDSETGTRMCVVHRDLKPANVLVERSGVAKITDFGIARGSRWMDEPEDRIEGTPPYMAPEQWAPEDARHVSPATDVFSLGCILYELLTNRRLVDAIPARSTATMVPEDVDTAMRRVEGVSRTLLQLLRGTLQPEPTERIQSAGEVANVLQGMAASHTELADHLGELGIWDRLDRIDQVVRQETPGPPAAGDTSATEATLSDRYNGRSGPDGGRRAGEEGVSGPVETTPDRTRGRSVPWLFGAGGLLAGALLVALLWWGTRVDVLVEGAPPGTLISVDGGEPYPLGNGRVTYSLLRPHTFRFECGGYLPHQVKLPAFSTFLNNRLEVSLIRAGALRVTLMPGAVVWVDGVLRGKSPLLIEGLPSGRPLHVQLVAEGGSTKELTVTLKPGEERALKE